MRLVAFHTEDRLYEFHAELLRRSVGRLGITLETESIKPRDWLGAVAYKPEFLMRVRERTEGPVLYVDADAFVHADPTEALSGTAADIGVHVRQDGEVLSGTVLVGDSEAARELLAEWACRMRASPGVWDQRVLQDILSEGAGGARVQHLPVEYAFIFDIGRDENPGLSPVIEHLQASREIRLKAKNRKLVRRLCGFRKRPDERLLDRRRRVSDLAAEVGMALPRDLA